jgi:plasmid stability protein
MAEIRVRNLEDWVVSWFRSQAKQHGESLEAELRQTLTTLAQQRKRAIADQLRAKLKEIEQKYGRFSDSAVLIRDDRDTRG